MITDEVNFETKEFIDICKSHQVKELYAFGSVVNGNMTDCSDVDLLVELEEPDPIRYGRLLLSLNYEFENYFHRKVDLLTPDSIQNYFLEDEINNTKELKYNGQKEKTV